MEATKKPFNLTFEFQSALELFVKITDDDGVFNDDIDEFVIPLNNRLDGGSSSVESTSYTGMCGRDTSITLSIMITGPPSESDSTFTRTRPTPTDGATATVVGAVAFYSAIVVAIAS